MTITETYLAKLSTNDPSVDSKSLIKNQTKSLRSGTS